MERAILDVVSIFCWKRYILLKWTASHKNGLSWCHSKRRMGVHGRTHPSFGMTSAFVQGKIFKKKKNL